jgi:two-component system, chemotaxis family, response regulator Rcp1
MRQTPQVLMVDDNPADVTLAMEAWAPNAQRIQVRFAGDGDQAMAYLDGMEREHNASPDLIILDLNLPRKNGRSVLADLKADPKRRAIPVVIFSTSQSPADVLDCYRLGANCYVRKPGNLADFVAVVRLIEEFWLECASLPGGNS